MIPSTSLKKQWVIIMTRHEQTSLNLLEICSNFHKLTVWYLALSKIGSGEMILFDHYQDYDEGYLGVDLFFENAIGGYYDEA